MPSPGTYGGHITGGGEVPPGHTERPVGVSGSETSGSGISQWKNLKLVVSGLFCSLVGPVQ